MCERRSARRLEEFLQLPDDIIDRRRSIDFHGSDRAKLGLDNGYGTPAVSRDLLSSGACLRAR